METMDSKWIQNLFYNLLIVAAINLILLPNNNNHLTTNYVAAKFVPNIDYAHNMRILLLPRETPVGTIVYRLKGSDADADKLTFGMKDELGQRMFTVKPANINEADVILKSPLEEDEYNVTIYVSDGLETTALPSTIKVTSPDIGLTLNPWLGEQRAIIIPENAKRNMTVGSVIARDMDGSSLRVKFELRDHDNKFALEYVFGPKGTSKANIILLEPLDYETKNLYILNVIAMYAWTNSKFDTRNVAERTVVVAVTDIAEPTSGSVVVSADGRGKCARQVAAAGVGGATGNGPTAAAAQIGSDFQAIFWVLFALVLITLLFLILLLIIWCCCIRPAGKGKGCGGGKHDDPEDQFPSPAHHKSTLVLRDVEAQTRVQSSDPSAASGSAWKYAGNPGTIGGIIHGGGKSQRVHSASIKTLRGSRKNLAPNVTSAEDESENSSYNKEQQQQQKDQRGKDKKDSSKVSKSKIKSSENSCKHHHGASCCAAAAEKLQPDPCPSDHYCCGVHYNPQVHGHGGEHHACGHRAKRIRFRNHQHVGAGGGGRVRIGPEYFEPPPQLSHSHQHHPQYESDEEEDDQLDGRDGRAGRFVQDFDDDDDEEGLIDRDYDKEERLKQKMKSRKPPILVQKVRLHSPEYYLLSRNHRRTSYRDGAAVGGGRHDSGSRSDSESFFMDPEQFHQFTSLGHDNRRTATLPRSRRDVKQAVAAALTAAGGPNGSGPGPGGDSGTSGGRAAQFTRDVPLVESLHQYNIRQQQQQNPQRRREPKNTEILYIRSPPPSMGATTEDDQEYQEDQRSNNNRTSAERGGGGGIDSGRGTDQNFRTTGLGRSESQNEGTVSENNDQDPYRDSSRLTSTPPITTVNITPTRMSPLLLADSSSPSYLRIGSSRMQLNPPSDPAIPEETEVTSDISSRSRRSKRSERSRRKSSIKTDDGQASNNPGSESEDNPDAESEVVLRSTTVSGGSQGSRGQRSGSSGSTPADRSQCPTRMETEIPGLVADSPLPHTSPPAQQRPQDQQPGRSESENESAAPSPQRSIRAATGTATVTAAATSTEANTKLASFLANNNTTPPAERRKSLQTVRNNMIPEEKLIVPETVLPVPEAVPLKIKNSELLKKKSIFALAFDKIKTPRISTSSAGSIIESS